MLTALSGGLTLCAGLVAAQTPATLPGAAFVAESVLPCAQTAALAGENVATAGWGRASPADPSGARVQPLTFTEGSRRVMPGTPGEASAPVEKAWRYEPSAAHLIEAPLLDHSADRSKPPLEAAGGAGMNSFLSKFPALPYSAGFFGGMHA